MCLQIKIIYHRCKRFIGEKIEELRLSCNKYYVNNVSEENEVL